MFASTENQIGGLLIHMTLGITVGKFYPFHVGHDYLIRAAKAQVDHLVVLVGYKPTQQVPGHKRLSESTPYCALSLCMSHKA